MQSGRPTVSNVSKKRKLVISVKQILVRNFNWRMGNLRRIEMNSYSLDTDLGMQMRELVYQQMDREQFKHEAGLMALKSGNPGGYTDEYLEQAIHESLHNACVNRLDRAR